MAWLRWNAFSLLVSLTWGAPAFAAEELKQLLDRLLATPTIQTASGFTAKVLVPPGSFYDPFDLYTRSTTLWVNDGGKEEGDKSGRILTVDAKCWANCRNHTAMSV